MAILGIDLGATKISYALFDHKGKIIIRGTSMVEKLSGQITGAILISIIREMNRDAIELNEKVEAIGICVPGIAFKDSGTVWAPNIAGWEKFPLLKNIRDSLENDSIPVVIESDRACHILGEHWRGAAQIIRNGIYLAVGTGIGAGIMVEGEILRGSGDISGAIGWMALNTPYDKKYDQCGCLEYYASGGGIERLFKKKMQEGNYSGILKDLGDKITAYHVFMAYDKKDPLALEIINDAIMYWGMATANLVSIFNPEVIIFGGGVFGPAVSLIDKIKDEARKWAQPISINKVKFIPSEIGKDAGLLGAGLIALKAIQ